MSERLIEGLWDCKYCGTKGIGGLTKVCPECDHPQDINVTFYLGDTKRYIDEEVAKDYAKGVDWVCPKCTTLNRYSNKFCTECGTSKTKSKYDYFSKPDNGSHNGEKLWTCSACGTKGIRERMETCPTCGHKRRAHYFNNDKVKHESSGNESSEQDPAWIFEKGSRIWIEGLWDCKYCNYAGIGGLTVKCPICGIRQEEGVTFYLGDKSRQIDEVIARKYVISPDWICSSCGNPNKYYDKLCAECSASRTISQINCYKEKPESTKREGIVHTVQRRRSVREKCMDYFTGKYRYIGSLWDCFIGKVLISTGVITLIQILLCICGIYGKMRHSLPANVFKPINTFFGFNIAMLMFSALFVIGHDIDDVKQRTIKSILCGNKNERRAKKLLKRAIFLLIISMAYTSLTADIPFFNNNPLADWVYFIAAVSSIVSVFYIFGYIILNFIGNTVFFTKVIGKRTASSVKKVKQGYGEPMKEEELAESSWLMDDKTIQVNENIASNPKGTAIEEQKRYSVMLPDKRSPLLLLVIMLGVPFAYVLFQNRYAMLQIGFELDSIWGIFLASVNLVWSALKYAGYGLIPVYIICLFASFIIRRVNTGKITLTERGEKNE